MVDKVFAYVDELAQIGRNDDGSITRLAFSSDDQRARNLVKGWLKQLHLEIREDGVGNIIAVKRGSGCCRKTVFVGSHVDTVIRGGRYDGVLGVAAGLAIIESLTTNGICHRNNVGLIVFAAEESSRFGLSTLGSKFFCGSLDPNFLTFVDDDGHSVADCARSKGFDLAAAERQNWVIERFLELHIDQSTDLVTRNAPLGLVTAIAAPTRMNITLAGEAAHSGAAKMDARRDALAAGAEVVLAVEELTRAFPAVTATASKIRIEPGQINVVPGRCELGLDIRSHCDESKAGYLHALAERIDGTALRRLLQWSSATLLHEQAVQLDPNVWAQLDQICRRRGLEAPAVVSPAGHDAMEMARIAPTALIFIRNPSGQSHNLQETVTAEDLTIALDVLTAAVFEGAEVTLP